MPLSIDIRPTGHGSFNTQLDVDSFSSLESSLASKHPDWSNQQSRKEALIFFNTQMFPKQVRSFFAERRGEKQMYPDEGWDVEGERLVHPLWGPFDKMIDNAQTEEERASLTLLQETMVKAIPGTRVVSIDHSFGKQGIRYADIVTKETNGRVRLEKRVEIATPHKPLEVVGAWIKLNTLAKSVEGRVVSNGVANVGILVINAQKETSEHLTDRLKTLSEASAVKGDFISQAIRESSRVTVTVMRDTKEGVTALGDFIFRQKAQRAENRGIEREIQITKRLKEKRLEKLQRQSTAAETRSKIKSRKQTKETRGKQKSREQNKANLVALFFAAKTRVGTGAGLWVLMGLAEEARSVTSAKKELRRKKKKNRLQEGAINKKESKEQVEKQSRSRRKDSLRRKTKEKRNITRRTKEKKHAKISEEQAQVKGQERRVMAGARLLLVMHRLNRFLRTLDSFPNKKKRNVEHRSIIGKEKMRQQQEVRRGRSEAPVHFFFAWALWLLLQAVSKNSLKQTRTKNKNLQTNEKNTSRRKEKLVAKEPVQWVLLSIIWHLAMIRESRGAGSRFTGHQKKSRQQKTAILMPRSATIFVFAPAPDPRGGSVRDFASRSNVFEARFVI